MNQQSAILIFNPALASKLDTDTAVILQQIKYWTLKCGRKLATCTGRWIYNSLPAWKKQFPQMSEYKIRKSIKWLEELGIVKSKKVNAKRWNHTKWYTIDFDKYNSLLEETTVLNPTKRDIAQRKKSSDRSDESQQIINIQENNYTNNNNSLSKSLSLSSKTNQLKNEKEERGEKKNIIEKLKQDFSTVRSQQEPNQINKPEKTAANMVKLWNDVFDGSQNQIRAYTNKRLVLKLKRLCKEKFNSNLETWKIYAKKVASSKFLMGERGDFKATFTWLLKEDVIDAILSDEYGVGDKTEHVDQNTVAQEMAETWHSHIVPQEALPKLNKSRAKKLARAFKHHFKSDMGEWKKFVSLIANSKFLMGEITGFKASLWWAIRENALLKIREGDYHSKHEWGRATAEQKQSSLLKDLQDNEAIDPRLKRLFLHAIKALGESTYISWFSKLKMDSFQDGVLKLKTDSAFVRDYIEMHYSRKLLSITSQYFERTRKICFAVSQHMN